MLKSPVSSSNIANIDFWIENSSLIIAFFCKITAVVLIIVQRMFDNDESSTIITFIYDIQSHSSHQRGRSWQPFGEGNNGNGKVCQARIYYIRNKCIFFCVIGKLQIQLSINMQCIPCNSALLVQETLFLTPKKHCF